MSPDCAAGQLMAQPVKAAEPSLFSPQSGKAAEEFGRRLTQIPKTERLICIHLWPGICFFKISGSARGIAEAPENPGG
jgi:hypothetical protein